MAFKKEIFRQSTVYRLYLHFSSEDISSKPSSRTNQLPSRELSATLVYDQKTIVCHLHGIGYRRILLQCSRRRRCRLPRALDSGLLVMTTMPSIPQDELVPDLPEKDKTVACSSASHRSSLCRLNMLTTTRRSRSVEHVAHPKGID